MPACAQNFATRGDRLSFAGSLGYLDGKYLSFITNIAGPIEAPTDVAAHRKIQNTPKWTMSGTLDYDTPAVGRASRCEHDGLLSQRCSAVRDLDAVP